MLSLQDLTRRCSALAAAILGKVRRDGLTSLIHMVLNQLKTRSLPRASDGFDDTFQTDTNGIIPLWKLDIRSPHIMHGVRYEPSDVTELQRSLASLQIPYEDFFFVDLGSGKGRALLVAATFPFRKIIGVEFSPALHAIACANVARYEDGRHGARVECVLMDATQYQFPHENLVIFLYNPFGAEVMQKVIENLKESRHDGCRVYLIYHNAEQARLFDANPNFTRVAASGRSIIYHWDVCA